MNLENKCQSKMSYRTARACEDHSHKNTRVRVSEAGIRVDILSKRQ